MMKRFFLAVRILFAVIPAAVACGKEALVPDGPAEPEVARRVKLTFDLSVTHAGEDDTKAVKTGWEDGDLIYVFFEDNTSQYLKMTYDGTSWSCSDKEDGTNYEGLSLSPSGKKLTAVWFPGYVNSEPPYLDGSVFRFKARQGYYLTAEGVDYTVSTEGNANRVSAALHMQMPDGFIQIYGYPLSIMDSIFMERMGECALTMSHVAPASCGAVTPGGSVGIDIGKSGWALPGLKARIGGSYGMYFYGILDEAKRDRVTTYNLQYVEYYKEAARRATFKSVRGARLYENYRNNYKPTRNKAVSLNIKEPNKEELQGIIEYVWNWPEPKQFVDLGPEHSVLWATGNLEHKNGQICNPYETGDYFKPGYSTPYDFSGETVPWDAERTPFSGLYVDAVAGLLGTSYETPTSGKYNDLLNHCTWNWTTWENLLGETWKGYLVTSNTNGLSLFFRCAGAASMGNVWNKDANGYYQCFDAKDYGFVWRLEFEENKQTLEWGDGMDGFSIRPVKRKQ